LATRGSDSTDILSPMEGRILDTAATALQVARTKTWTDRRLLGQE